MAVIECVPNLSEGRRPEVLEACRDAILGAGVHLLDVSADRSHNRAVFTFAGGPDAVRAAVLALYDAAVPAIDLRRHRGEHPRIGAVDVVPFVPLAGATMAACVALAADVGRAVADRHGLPVFLYEEAATDPARRRLEHVRRGQFEGLAAKLAQPGWTPDFGPSAPHPSAGASAIGARRLLIAYNVNLATDRLDVARQVAAAVRESSGGLPCVKAMAVTLAERGIVQVSMNLTDVERAPMHRVFERVREEAARHGVSVLESEVVGLVPAAALAAAAAAWLQLGPSFSDARVLEAQLARASGEPGPAGP
jgi:glutamate formiminotransferase